MQSIAQRIEPRVLLSQFRAAMQRINLLNSITLRAEQDAKCVTDKFINDIGAVCQHISRLSIEHKPYNWLVSHNQIIPRICEFICQGQGSATNIICIHGSKSRSSESK